MQLTLSTHFVGSAKAVLYCGADLDTVWPQLSGITIVLFSVSLMRFSSAIVSFQLLDLGT
jgi:hypothetical protein